MMSSENRFAIFGIMLCGNPAAFPGRTLPIRGGTASFFRGILIRSMMESPLSSPWWTPDVYADRRPFLRVRRALTAAARAWFEGRGFAEVETPILQVSPGNETHLHAFATALAAPGGESRALYLHTSPEFACKKLLAAGEDKIFTLARTFRNRERGALHHPEFTMLEWYRANAPYETLMDDCAALAALAARTGGRTDFAFGGRAADPFAEPERITVAQAFARYAAIDLLATLPDARADRGKLARAARAAGIRIADDDTWSDIFSRVMVERVEPNLGNGRLTILREYPAPEAALARPADDPRVAQRFEVFACGVELANGFGELTDPAEQRRRFEHAMAEKQRIYGERYPIDADFIAALAHMPPASGVALGFDRLAMLAGGATRIEQVLWAPVVDPGG
jgi:lysyl-tRNA synthetase class 2